MNYKNFAIDLSKFALYMISAYVAAHQYGLIGIIPAGFLYWISMQNHD